MVLGMEPGNRLFSPMFYRVLLPVLFIHFNLETSSHYIAQASPEHMLLPRKALNIQFSFLSLPSN